MQDKDSRRWVQDAVAALRAAPISENGMCCFCGESVTKVEVLDVSICREGTQARQHVRAHPTCLQEAMKPVGIDLELFGVAPAPGRPGYFPDQRELSRRDIERATPAQRVAQAISLSRTLTRIAAMARGPG